MPTKSKVSILRKVKWKLRDFKDKVSCTFRPRQKWLTDKIPKSWSDKTEIIPLLLFACLIDFVDNEKGIDQMNTDWDEELKHGFISQEYVDSIMSTCKELFSAYNYVKNERPVLQERLSKAYPDLNFGENGISSDIPYKVLYKEVNRIEKEIEKKDMKAMQTIVKHHQFMWT